VASVVKDEPRLDRAPPEVRRLLRKCLEKDPRRRLRDIGDVWELVEDTPPRISPRRSRIAWIAAASLAVIAALALWAPWRTPPPAPDVRRYQIPMDASASAPFREFAVSPDVRKLAYLTREAGVRRLWIHSLDSLESRSVPAAEVAAGLAGPSGSLPWRPFSLSGRGPASLASNSRALDPYRVARVFAFASGSSPLVPPYDLDQDYLNHAVKLKVASSSTAQVDLKVTPPRWF
jgi:hypothetical protein